MAAGGMQWKKRKKNFPPCFSLRLPSTPPSRGSYITPVCEHSSQHSFSRLNLATQTPRPPPSAPAHPLAGGRLAPGCDWMSRPSLWCSSLSAHVDGLSYWHSFPLQGETEEEGLRVPDSPQAMFLRWIWKMLRLPHKNISLKTRSLPHNTGCVT